MSACRSCNATIEWAMTDNAHPMPLDPGVHEDGRVAVVGSYFDELGRVSPLVVSLTGDQLARLRAAFAKGRAEVALRRSHFQTCPEANEWRGKG